MASPSSSDPAEIRRRGRHRLIGAIVIAILLVVFVPMFLDSEPRPAREEPALEIPSKEKAPPLPPSLPAASRPAAKATSSAGPAGPTADAVPAQAGTQTPAPKKAEGARPAAAPKLEGFAVQVGAFKDEEKLRQARDKLAAASISHYIERRPSSSGDLTRLRAGPYPTREAAEKALATLKATGLDGQVVPLP